MLKGATARRYAQAVFELATEQRTQERWLADLRAIEEYFGNRQLAFILSEPNVQFGRKEQVVRDLLGGKVQQDALGLALLLVERGLVSLAPRIRFEFERMYDEFLGQAHAEVTTATPLDEQTRELLKRELAEITGKRILLHEHVDPSILGGAVARVGDTLIDGSVRRRLALLRQQIIRGGTLGGPENGRGPNGSGGPGGPGGPGNGGPAGDGTAPFVVTPASNRDNQTTGNGGNGGSPGQRP
jgi:F-type H+-transporting ATPase subunit delta